MDFLNTEQTKTYELFFNVIDKTQKHLINILDGEIKIDKEQVEEYICIEESFILELKNNLEYFYSENNRDDEFYEIEDQYEDLEKAIENFWEDYED
jgi:hypothetical protein